MLVEFGIIGGLTSYLVPIIDHKNALEESISGHHKFIKIQNQRLQDLETQVSELSSQLEDNIYGSGIDLDHPLSKKVGLKLHTMNITYDEENNKGTRVFFEVLPGPTLMAVMNNYNGNPYPDSTVIVKDQFGDGNPYSIFIEDHISETHLTIKTDLKGHIHPDSSIVSREGAKLLFDKWVSKYNSLCSDSEVLRIIKESPNPKISIIEYR